MRLHRIACGKIIETWNAGDADGLYQQLGLLRGRAVPFSGTPTTPAASPQRACPPDDDSPDQAVAARRFKDAINPRRLTSPCDFVPPAGVLHATGFPDAMAAVFAALFAGFSDLQFSGTTGPAPHGLVVESWTATGTRVGVFQGTAPTGHTLTWCGMTFHRIACGKIAEF